MLAPRDKRMSCDSVRAGRVFVNSVGFHLCRWRVPWTYSTHFIFLFEQPLGWPTAAVSSHVCVSSTFSISIFRHVFINQSLRSSFTASSSPSFLTFTSDGQSEYDKRLTVHFNFSSKAVTKFMTTPTRMWGFYFLFLFSFFESLI